MSLCQPRMLFWEMQQEEKAFSAYAVFLSEILAQQTTHVRMSKRDDVMGRGKGKGDGKQAAEIFRNQDM